MIPSGPEGKTKARQTTGETAAAPTVAAVVVTYNRKELLVRCLDCILAQTRPPDRIILVDNCSTDGTQELLSCRGYLNTSLLEYVRLPDNLGSAGGFYAGMKRAYEHGYDWLWLMDDDGMAAANTLGELLRCPSHVLFRGCVVLNRESVTEDDLAFGEECPSGIASRARDLEVLGNSEGIVDGVVNPSNGVLISNDVIRRIGLWDKRLFIWGDDIEYRYRALKAGTPVATVLSAKFYHPPDRGRTKRVSIGSLSFGLRYADDPVRFYLIVRNHTYITLRYRGPLSRTFLKVLAYPVLFPRTAKLALRGLRDGVFGRFPPLSEVQALTARQR